MTSLPTLTSVGGLTREYLGALGADGWLKLAAVVFLLTIGPGIGSNLFRLAVVATGESSPVGSDPGRFVAPAVAALAGFAAIRYLAAVAEFVFVESLRTRRLPLREFTRRNLRLGSWLFGFRVIVGGVALAAVAAPVAAAVEIGGITEPAALTSAWIVAIGGVGLLTLVSWWVIDTLTTGFVVPIMQCTDCGPVAGWRRFGRATRAAWRPVAGFVALALVVGTALAIGASIIGFVVTVFGGAAFVIVGAAITEAAPSLEWLVGGLLVVAVLGYGYVIAALKTPVRSYVRYYALVALGGMEPALNPINEYHERGADGNDRADPTA